MVGAVSVSATAIATWSSRRITAAPTRQDRELLVDDSSRPRFSGPHPGRRRAPGSACRSVSPVAREVHLAQLGVDVAFGDLRHAGRARTVAWERPDAPCSENATLVERRIGSPRGGPSRGSAGVGRCRARCRSKPQGTGRRCAAKLRACVGSVRAPAATACATSSSPRDRPSSASTDAPPLAASSTARTKGDVLLDTAALTRRPSPRPRPAARADSISAMLSQ